MIRMVRILKEKREIKEKGVTLGNVLCRYVVILGFDVCCRLQEKEKREWF